MDPSILIYEEESSLEKHDQLVFVYNFGVGDSDAVIVLSLYPVAVTFVFELLSTRILSGGNDYSGLKEL